MQVPWWSGFVVVVVCFIVCSCFISGLSPESMRSTTVVEQSGLLLVLVGETVHGWGAMQHLSKEALGKTYCGILACFRWFVGRTKKVGLCCLLDVLRKDDPINDCLNKFSKMGEWKKLKRWGNESWLKLCTVISQHRGMFGHFCDLSIYEILSMFRHDYGMLMSFPSSSRHCVMLTFFEITYV